MNLDENKLEEIVKESTDGLKDEIQEKLVSELQTQMKMKYEEFNSSFEDFKYKYSDGLESQFKNFSDFKENLSQVLVDKIDPISQEIKKLLK